MQSLQDRDGGDASTELQRFLKTGETAEELYRRAAREVRKWRMIRRAILGTSFAGFFFGPIVCWLMQHSPLASAMPMFMFLLIVGTMLGLLAGMLMRPTRHNALYSLLQMNDPRAIGPLLEAMRIMIPDIAAQAGVALIRLLPTLEPEHAILLTPLHRRYLRGLIEGDAPKRAVNPSVSSLINTVNVISIVPSYFFDVKSIFSSSSNIFGYRSPELSIAIIETLARIGDATDMELVQRIAPTPVQQAALRCRLMLEDNLNCD